MDPIDPTKAHITLEDGTQIQVLNAEGTDWDEAATGAAVAEHLANADEAED